jgi:predicted transcriptional regulator
MKQLVSIRLSPEALCELDKLAGSHRVSRSRIIEHVINQFLENDRVSQNVLITRMGSK